MQPKALKAGRELSCGNMVMNITVDLESVPAILKRGVVVPVYKRGGKDPSYEDRQLQSDHTHIYMVARFWNLFCWNAYRMVFMEAGLPHINQSAYRCAVSCGDAVFVTQEFVVKYLIECTCGTSRKLLIL